MYLDKIEDERNVLDLARERVAIIFDRFDHVCVSFSGGKDSTCCLNICLDEHRRRHGTPPGVSGPRDSGDPEVATSRQGEIGIGGASPEGNDGDAGAAQTWDGAKMHVLFYDEEAISYQTEEYVRRVAQLPDVELTWLCLPVRHLNACSPAHPWWYPWDPDVPDKWVRPMPPEGIGEWPGFPVYPVEDRPQVPDATGLFFDPKVHGVVAFVMGIRADESMTRLRAVTRKKEENWIVQHLGTHDKGNVWKCYPIYDWKTADVWTAPKAMGWDYNQSYDIQELIGIHGSGQRIAPPYGAEPMQMLHMYAKGFPEVWDKMVDRVPGAAAAARYSRTELYGFRGRPAPKQGETWQQLIERLLSKHSPENRQEVASRLQQEIRWHYMKIREMGWRETEHPILPTAPHPLTGMSWEWCAMIALRGDVKRRKTAGWELGEDSQEQREKLWAAYRQQFEETQFAKRTVG
jgi:predicted phosphoadenosine phosphosulfate sulfurtransferase